MTLPRYPEAPLPWAPALAGWFGRPARCRARLWTSGGGPDGYRGRCDLAAHHVALDAPAEHRDHALERGLVTVRFDDLQHTHLEIP